MRNLLLILLTLLQFSLIGQEECQLAYISDAFVINQSSDTLSLYVDHKDQVNFTTDGPIHYLIAPGERALVGSLEWAEEFRNPTTWYVFSTEEGIDRLLNQEELWQFSKRSETEGAFIFRLK